MLTNHHIKKYYVVDPLASNSTTQSNVVIRDISLPLCSLCLFLYPAESKFERIFLLCSVSPYPRAYIFFEILLIHHFNLLQHGNLAEPTRRSSH